MLKIKLARFGKRKQPHYRIVINEARSKRDGQYVEKIGSYAPSQEPKHLELDLKRYDYWIDKGAQPTDTVASLAKRYRSGDPFPKKEAEADSKEKEAQKKKKALNEVTKGRGNKKKQAKDEDKDDKAKKKDKKEAKDDKTEKKIKIKKNK
jgi:small subunit ribosomal protein S16